LHVPLHSLMPLVAAAMVTIFATCLAAMGIRRFYDRPISWPQSFLIAGLSTAILLFFTVVFDSKPTRILVFSIGQALPFALTLKLLLAWRDGRITPGARLAGIVIALIVATYAIRGSGSLVGVDLSFSRSSAPQAVAVMVLLFLSMSLNFGFLLMAMD